MQRKSILFLVFLIFISVLSAMTVDFTNAKKVAKNYMKIKKNSEEVLIKNYFIRKDDDQIIYYAFNFESGGFVILSGDDRVTPIIGYSTKNYVVEEIKNEAVKNWMNRITKKIIEVKKENIKATSSINKKWSSLKEYKKEYNILKGTPVVEPLLNGDDNSSYEDDILWDQGSIGDGNGSFWYYNYYTPMDGDSRAPVGCVATALAQIFKYWEYPNKPMGIHAYYDDKWNSTPELQNIKIFEDYVNTSDTDIYDWEYMPNSIYYYYPEDQSWYLNPGGSSESNWKEASQLGYDIGVAVNMAYAGSGSGAYLFIIPDIAKKYFNYADTIEYISKNGSISYSDTEWKNILKEELDNGRPIEYAGSGDSGGHAFVCDGYDNEDQFHFNWGWAGRYNGYFNLSNLNPGGSNFSDGQEAVIGIQPWSELEKAAPPVAEYQSGTYPVSQLSQINLYQDNDGTIQYSISYDGSDPGIPSTTYSSPISLSSGNHVRIKVETTGVTGLSDSVTKEYEYHIVGQSDIANPLDDIFEGEWETGGISPLSWQEENYIYTKGSSSLRSPDLIGGVNVINDTGTYSQYQSAYIKKTIYTSAGVISFDWKINTESGDRIIFFIDGEKKDESTGDVDWTSKSFTVDEGTHTFMWLLETDFYTSPSPNEIYLDNLVFPGLTEFSIISDNESVTTGADNVQITWEKAGYGDINYQVQYKIGSDSTNWYDIGSSTTGLSQTISCDEIGKWYVRVEAYDGTNTKRTLNYDDFLVSSISDLTEGINFYGGSQENNIFDRTFIDLGDDIKIQWADENDNSIYNYYYDVTLPDEDPVFDENSPISINLENGYETFFISKSELDQLSNEPGEYTFHLKCMNSGSSSDYLIFSHNFNRRNVVSGILPDLLNDKYFKIIGKIEGFAADDINLVNIEGDIDGDGEIDNINFINNSDGSFVTDTSFNITTIENINSINVTVDNKVYYQVSINNVEITNDLTKKIGNIKFSGDRDKIYYIPVKDQMGRLPEIEGNIYFIGDVDSDIYYEVGENQVIKKLIGNNWSTVNKIDGTGYYALTSGTVPKIENNLIKQNFPNPFNPETIIPITVKEQGNVKLMVYSANGKHVKTLVNEHYSTPRENVNIKWDGKDKNGDVVSSGIYYAILSVNGKKCVRKMVLLK